MAIALDGGIVGMVEEDPGAVFSLEPDRLSRVLLGTGSPEQTLERVLELWGLAGVLASGAVYLKRACGWAKLAYWPREPATMMRDPEPAPETRHTRPGEGRSTRALRRLLSMPGLSHDGRPSPTPRRDGDFLCYSLGGTDEEIARLVLRPRVQTQNGVEQTSLPMHIFSSLGLFLYSLKDREQGAAVALRGDLSRRLFSTRTGGGESGSWRWKEDFPEIIGRSRKMGEVLAMVRRAAPSNVSIHISGESGTGKEMIARAIHSHSKRQGPFVSENCAAFSETLLEAEIFGSEKGAFTGADRSRVGLIERAQEGTLFLDEIGEMAPALQSKLLRVLQEREVRRVGGSEMIPVDFRLVTATHRNLEREVREGRFREDLLFRILVINVTIPPLRDRPEDVPLLVKHFLDEIARSRGLPNPVIHEAAQKMLAEYHWPGNIRELRNEIERALTLSPDVIGPDSLSNRFERPFIPNNVARRVRDELGADIFSLERVVLGGVIQEVLEETGGNKAQAARILGIPKTNLYRRLHRYGIKS